MEATTQKNNQGVSQFLGKNFKKAESHFKSALLEDASNCTAMNNLGLLYHNSGEYELAAELFRKAISTFEKDTYYLNLANTLVLLKSYEEAEEAYQKSLELNPRNGNAMLSLVRFYTLTGHLLKATPVLERLAAGTGELGIRLELAKNYIGIGSFERALTILFQLKPMEKQGLITHYIGICEFHLKNYGLAKSAFLSVLGQNPDHKSSRHYLALTYLFLDELHESLKVFDYLIKVFPEETNYRLDKIAVLLKLKRDQQAKIELDQVLQLDSQNQKAKRYLTHINGINQDQ